MRRFVLFILFIPCYSLTFSQTFLTQEYVCEEKKKEAILDFEKGTIYFVRLITSASGIPRYKKELKEILHTYGVKYIEMPISSIGLGGEKCYKAYMDSVINSKHGSFFMNGMFKKADSLYLERNMNKIFDYWDVDIRATHASHEKYYCIQYLNAKNPYSGIIFDANTIGNPHFILKVIIDKSGNITKCIVTRKETSNLEQKAVKEEELQKFIVNSIEEIDDWNPAQIQGQNVTSHYKFAVSIRYK